MSSSIAVLLSPHYVAAAALFSLNMPATTFFHPVWSQLVIDAHQRDAHTMTWPI